MGSSEDVGTSDLFHLKARLQIPPSEIIENVAKVTVGGFNYFAASVKYSGSLLLVSDGYPRPPSGSGVPDIGPVEKKWSLRQIPWFTGGSRKISALSFSGDGVLYVGTQDGYIYEINSVKVMEGLAGIENELKIVFHLHDFEVIQLVVWHRENMKMILCNGDNSRLAIIHANALPVLVTFLSNINHLEIFTNSVGLSCLLVCLENSSNVYCVLDDLEIPVYEPEAPGKKSLFRKARDNFMSKFSDEKMNFFNRKGSKDPGNQTNAQRPNTVVSSTSIPAVATTPGSGSHVGGNSVLPPKQYPISNIKFLPVEEAHCRGLLRKIFGKNQFSRHVNNKLDIFDGDFRQTAAVYIPNHINKLYVIQRIFFGIDEENKCVRISVVHSGTLKEFAVIPITSKILSIEPLDEDDPSVAPYSVFIISQNGIYEICLKKTPLETCVDLLLKETNNVMLDVLCIALNVSKADVCVLAGDTRAEEGKFAKSILYYKIAGLNYMKIMAKFGSRGHIPAMLCFYELMEQEQRNKLSGNNNDRQTMANLALAARIEQCLRHGKSVGDISRSPKNLLKNMLNQNLHYSAKQAALMLCHVQLLWALKLVGSARLCYSYIFQGLHDKPEDMDVFAKKRAFWEILTSDWLTIYSATPSVFAWFRTVVLKNCQEITNKQLYDLLMVLIPWRRELQPKFQDARSPHATEIIDFTVTNDTGRVSMDDYISLFITLILEAVRRKDLDKFSLPNFVFKSSNTALDTNNRSNSTDHSRKDSEPKQVNLFNVSNSLTTKLFSASSHHCACIRNGKIFTWGENKVGRLGHSDDRLRLNVETPTVINLCPTLRLSVVSVSCGINHTIALTSTGTIFVWGSNALGQLGFGNQAMWTSKPTPLTIQSDVIIIRVAAGGYHSVAVDNLNRVWTWGWGVHGQLGDGGFENSYRPQLIKVPESIISASAGHSHTALLSKTGRVYTCGCAHFGQIGQGVPQKKVKVPTLMYDVPPGVIFRSVDCGLCSTAMVSTKNKLYYAGLNPGTLRTILSGQKRREQRNNAIAAGIPQSEIVFEEEKDFSLPVIIDTSHLAGEIVKVNVATTHMCVLTSLGFVYTWGLGKSGQLVRPDDDSRTLELIDTEDKIFIASDISCGGDCTFVIEKDSNRCYGCGFNSSGQLGKLQTDEESAVMTIKTKKRVVKVRQPSNIYFRLREIMGLPKPMWDREQDGVSGHTISPKSPVINQDLLEWVLRAYKRNYDPKVITKTCLQYENYAAASLLETMAENHEFALKHSLALEPGNKESTSGLIGSYLNQMEKSNAASVQQACRFLRVVISHWAEHSLLSCDLEEILDPFLSQPPWNVYLNCAVKDIISSADDSAKWIAATMTPRFILRAIRDSKNGSTFGAGSASSSVVTSPTSLASPNTNPLSPSPTAPGPPPNYSRGSHGSGEENFKINGIRQQLSSSNSKHEDMMGSGRDNNNLDFQQS